MLKVCAESLPIAITFQGVRYEVYPGCICALGGPGLFLTLPSHPVPHYVLWRPGG